MKREPCAVSVADHAGWAHVICTAASDGVPAVIERRRVTLIDKGLPTLPYHHDTLMMTVHEADALIARVRLSIATRTADALTRLVTDLAPAYSVVALTIREPPFFELPETVTVVRKSYRLQCAADGVLFHLAIRHTARQLGLQVHMCRRGEETSRVADRLGVTPQEVEEFVRRTGRPAGPPWTQEHRRAFASGIAALAVHAEGRLTIPRA